MSEETVVDVPAGRYCPRIRFEELRSLAVMATFVAVGVLVLAALGLLLASAWYADDACPTAQWKCDFGSLGVVMVGLALPIGAVVAVVALVLWIVAARRRVD
jgi:ABC-type transport system involved in cytochrome c biogenesis permease subunit